MLIHHFATLPDIYSWRLLQKQLATNIITITYRTPELSSAIRGTPDRPVRNTAWKTLHYDKGSGPQRQANAVCTGKFTGRNITATNPEYKPSLQELPKRACHFTNSLGGMSLQLPRRDYHSKNSRGGTVTPRTLEEGLSLHQLPRRDVTPPTPEEGLSLQELPRRDCHSKNSREETVTPPTPEEGLLLQELPRKDCHAKNSRVRNNIRKAG